MDTQERRDKIEASLDAAILALETYSGDEVSAYTDGFGRSVAIRSREELTKTIDSLQDLLDKYDAKLAKMAGGMSSWTTRLRRGPQ